MTEIHVTVTGPQNEVTIVAHNPGVAPSVKGAGQPIAVLKDSSGKTLSASGQVAGTTVVHSNPA